MNFLIKKDPNFDIINIIPIYTYFVKSIHFGQNLTKLGVQTFNWTLNFTPAQSI